MESLQSQEHRPNAGRFAEIRDLREATCDHAPNGDHAQLVCDCFDGMHQAAAAEVQGIEGDPARLQVLRTLWERMLQARQTPEA